MRRTISVIIILLFGFSLVLAVDIDSCKSYGKDNWHCQDDDICICEFSGDCTDGRLLVYETDIRTLFCMPKIVDGYADINWGNCDYPTGEVKVRADCEEGQSEERTIELVSGNDNGNGNGDTTTTTTSTTIVPCNFVCQATCTDDNNPPFCYRRISHGTDGCPEGTICCESILKECPSEELPITTTTLRTCPYECCIDMPEYEYRPCPSGKTCKDNLCKEETREPILPNIPRSLLFWVVLASIIPILAFLIFIWGSGDRSKVPEY